jgi:hypothetical protein
MVKAILVVKEGGTLTVASSPAYEMQRRVEWPLLFQGFRAVGRHGEEKLEVLTVVECRFQARAAGARDRLFLEVQADARGAGEAWEIGTEAVA